MYLNVQKAWWPSLWVAGPFPFVLQMHNHTSWIRTTEINDCVGVESLRPAIAVNILKAKYILKECGGSLKCGRWEYLKASEQSLQRRKKWLYFSHNLSKVSFAAFKQIKMIIGDLLLQRCFVCMCVCVCMCKCTHISKTFLFLRGKLFLYSLNVRLLISSMFSPTGKFLFFHVSPDTGESLRRVTQGGAHGLASSPSLPAFWGLAWCTTAVYTCWSAFSVCVGAATLRARAPSHSWGLSQSFENCELALGRENVSLIFWVNSMFFPRG